MTRSIQLELATASPGGGLADHLCAAGVRIAGADGTSLLRPPGD